MPRAARNEVAEKRSVASAQRLGFCLEIGLEILDSWTGVGGGYANLSLDSSSLGLAAIAQGKAWGQIGIARLRARRAQFLNPENALTEGRWS